jgi:hypothetical protein
MSFSLLKTVRSIAALTLTAAALEAATLTTVPMQGGMVMPMVSYNAQAARLEVMMPSEVPQLTPLLVSNPGDGFDAADPWFAALDPSARGDSFSRRYGFVMAPETDLLPEGTQMWIRKLSGPAELGVYQYSGSAPKAMEPIFGTAGSPLARPWSGMMFHPLFTAPPGTNELVASFQLYLVNTGSGQEVTGSASEILEFRWSNVSDGRPALTVAQRVVIAWPEGTGAQWVLEATDSLTSGVWEPVTNAPVILDGKPAVVLEGAASQRTFRMRFVP